MNTECPIVNHSAELSACRDQWTFDEQHNCWCLEDVLYVQEAETPLFQRLSIFVPKAFLNEDGTVNEKGTAGAYQARNAPIVFENNSAGYMQMPHTWLGGPRNYGKQYLDHGLIYVTCGCRGRDSRDQNGVSNGKSPITLVDLKTAIRFLRHNRAALPGDMERIISVGWSAGGAMSSLLAVTGDNEAYLPYLRANHAFMEESDAVFAAQIYCPIIDLEHADQAYEWMFGADKTNEDSHAGSAETMTPFKEALSRELAKQYVGYVNGMGLTHPKTGEALKLSEDGRGGSFYAYLMDCLSDSATDFLKRLDRGELEREYTSADYLAGRYVYEAPAPMPPMMHHAGPGVGVAEDEREERPGGLGVQMLRPAHGGPAAGRKLPMVTCQGKEKPWLRWNGERAVISDLDAYVLAHRRRMKPCTSFDTLPMNSGENQEFGDAKHDYVHYNHAIADAIEAVKASFPKEAARYAPAFAAAKDDKALAERVKLINPMRFIGTDEKSKQAKHYRIRVGASDADTSLSISMTLALALRKAGCGTVDYAMVWDQPHCEADYPGEVLSWIDSICSPQRKKFEKKAVIFDLDGVICFTDKFHYQAWKALADLLGIYFDEKINDRLRGVSRMASLDIILERSTVEYTPEQKEAFAVEKNDTYRELLKNMTPADLADEVRDTLTELRNRGYKLAIGSSSKNTKFILERIGLGDFFDAIADGTDITRSKPDPEVFLKSAQKIGIDPADCAVVEDARAGIEAAKAGGMTALALFGDAKGCGLEDYDLKSFRDLLNIL